MNGIFEEEGESGEEKEVYSRTNSGGDRGESGAQIVRNERGQFLKGHAPPAPARKRKPRQEEQALIAALHTALPAEQVGAHLSKCIEWAYEYRSPKLLLQVLQFHYSYVLGMPVQRTISASGKLENLLSRLTDMDEDQFQTVEAAMRGDDGSVG